MILHRKGEPIREHFDAIESSGCSVSLFTDWQKQRINELWIKSRMEEGQVFHATPEFYGAKLATRNMHPIAALSAENCTEQMGVPGPWYERLPHFRMGFTPSAGKGLQSEYFVPRQHAVEAILPVEKLRDQVSPSLLITEIRTIASDKLWMSPCYEQDSNHRHIQVSMPDHMIKSGEDFFYGLSLPWLRIEPEHRLALFLLYSFPSRIPV